VWIAVAAAALIAGSMLPLFDQGHPALALVRTTSLAMIVYLAPIGHDNYGARAGSRSSCAC
jgi:hypothetical protein